MKAPLFEQAKLKRFLATHGVEYTFSRNEKDKFKEQNGAALVAKFVGVYHETTSTVMITGTEAAQIRSKPTPMILTDWENAKVLLPGDYVELNGKKYNVISVSNYQNWDIFGDISMEVVDGGTIQV